MFLWFKVSTCRMINIPVMRSIVLLICCLFTTACVQKWGDNHPHDFIMLPGDAVTESGRVDIVSSNGKTQSSYSYSFDLYITYDTFTHQYVPINLFNGTEYLWPSDEYLERFGSNSDYVKSGFKDLVFGLFDETPQYNYYASTVFPMGLIKVYANDIVNGVAAGEDLLDQFWEKPSFTGTASFPNNVEPVTSLSIDDPRLLPDELQDNNCFYHWRFYINSSDTNFTPISERKDIIFTFTIPVRKVLILQWINDRKDNPDAPMPYIDTELTWRISTKTGQLK